jgi:ubiquinone/menaquinone biosynthesis C-methylase UbiE
MREERRRFWDRMATDATGDLASEDRPEYHARRQKMLADLLAHPFKGKAVLEVGCGPGGNLAAIEALKPKVLTGCDVSPEMLARAKARTRADLVQSEEDKLPFADRQFDVVFTVTVLQQIPDDAEAMIAEMARVAKRTILVYEDMAEASELAEPRYPWVPRPQAWYADAFAKEGFGLVSSARIDALVGHADTEDSGFFRMEFARERRIRP